MTSKQRAYLKGLAMTMEPIFQVGKSSATPEFTKAVDEALTARELIKLSVLWRARSCRASPACWISNNIVLPAQRRDRASAQGAARQRAFRSGASPRGMLPGVACLLDK